MSTQPNFTNQLTKILDTNTPRKEGLKNFYMMVVEITKMLDISDDAKGEIFKNMLEVSKKLAKVADAVDKYEKTEKKELKRLVKEVSKHGNPDLILAEDSSKLEATVEEALSQGKSALDVAVKVLEPLLGIKLNTYSKAGADVVKALRNNVPADLQTKAQFLIEMIETEAQSDWLKSLKKYRDDQHYKNLGITPLRANSRGESERPSMPGGQPVAQFLTVVYVNLFTFTMDFLAGAMYIKLYNGLGLVSEGEDLSKKFRLALVNPPEPS